MQHHEQKKQHTLGEEKLKKCILALNGKEEENGLNSGAHVRSAKSRKRSNNDFVIIIYLPIYFSIAWSKICKSKQVQSTFIRSQPTKETRKKIIYEIICQKLLPNYNRAIIGRMR